MSTNATISPLVGSLQDQDLAVAGALDFDFAAAAEHVFTHVRQDDPTTAQSRKLLVQGRVVEVILDPLLEEIGLADEHVCPPYDVQQRVGPLGVAGVGDDPAAALDPEGKGWRTAGVPDREGGGGHEAQTCRRPVR